VQIRGKGEPTSWRAVRQVQSGKSCGGGKRTGDRVTRQRKVESKRKERGSTVGGGGGGGGEEGGGGKGGGGGGK